MADSLVTRIRNLQRRGARRRQALAVLEGVRLVEEALASGLPLRGAVVSPSLRRTERGRALHQALRERGATVEERSEREIRDLADTDTPQGVVALGEIKQWTLGEVTRGGGRLAPVIVLDGVQDPGNVGTILRTTWGLGGAGVLLLPGTAWPNHPKVLRASMGAGFHLPVIRVSVPEFQEWVQVVRPVVWAASASGRPVGDLSRPERVAILVGNEGAGVRPELVGAAAERVAVPIRPGADSLNAAVAAAILLYEVVRDH